MKQIIHRLGILSAAAIVIVGIATMACRSEMETSANNSKVIGETARQNAATQKNAETAAVNSPVETNKNVNQSTETVSRKCTLTKAPQIKNFALGQTPEELDRRIPGFKAAYEKEKENETDQNKKTGFVLVTSGSQGLENSILDGKEYSDYSFIWHFLDGKLIGYVVQDLSDATAEMDLKKFLSKVAQENNLPKDGWKIGKEDDADLTCQGFEVSITAGGQPGMSIMIFDSEGEKEKKKRER